MYNTPMETKAKRYPAFVGVGRWVRNQKTGETELKISIWPFEARKSEQGVEAPSLE